MEAYNSLKAEFEAYKQSKMTDDEKKAEQEKVKEEAYQKANLTISRMYAENTFAKAGFKEEDYKGILDGIVQEDPEKTKGLAEIICNTMLKQKQEIEKTITDKIVNGTKTPPAGNDGTDSSKLENYKKLYDEAQKKGDYAKMAYYTRLVQQAQNNNEE